MALRKEEENLWAGDYVYFRYEGQTASGRTKVWSLLDGNMGTMGQIKWYAPWRKYGVFFVGLPVLESGCLRDIADFLDKLTVEHKDEQVKVQRGAD